MRTYNIPTQYESQVKSELNGLLEHKNNPESYKKNMLSLGNLLAHSFADKLSTSNEVLAVSTAEDADFLLTGVLNVLKEHNIRSKLAIFWNHHHSLPNGQSVAPILSKYIDENYDKTDTIVIVKSVISGSCVVRTNLLALLEQVKKVKHIFVVSPVMHKNAQKALSSEFPQEISSKFEYIYFAKDDEKTSDGEVVPGIGGQIYELLGIDNQPVLTGYMPRLVSNALFG